MPQINLVNHVSPAAVALAVITVHLIADVADVMPDIYAHKYNDRKNWPTP